MVDANQVWTIDEAKSRAARFEKYDLYWIEEPIRCDRPLSEWEDLAGIIYCQHSLAGAVGLMASAHLLAAGRCPGMLEIDANDNPLRTDLIDAFPAITDGGIRLPDTPGLGGEPDLRVIEKYRVAF